jgi:hypothetical protein
LGCGALGSRSNARKPAKNYICAKRLINMDENILYSKTIEENMDKGFQVRLAVNDFRDITYIQLRKFFLSYEGEWIPSREGVSIPASTENIYALLDGLFDICSQAEGEEIIRHYVERLKS